MNKLLLSALVLGISAFSAPMTAEAKSVKKDVQQVQYDVYAGGIHALQANMTTDESQKDKYNVALTAKTYGMLGKLAPWSGAFKSSGWKVGDVYKPEFHQATTTWKAKEEIKKYRYKKDGSFAGYSVQDDKKDGSIRKTDNKLVQGTTDILSATMATMQGVTAQTKCEGSSEIFDGKRRFKLNFQEKKKVTLESSRYNAYEGPAIECSVEVRPVAGKWREKPRGWMSIQEQGRERGTMPTVWFATVQEGQVAIPVKVRVKTSYGTMFMHMTDYQTAGKKLASKK